MLLEKLLDPLVETFEVGLDLLSALLERHRHRVRCPTHARLPGVHRRREAGPHPVGPLHQSGHRRGRGEVARHPGAVVTGEEEPFPCQRRQGHHDVGLHLRAPLGEPLLLTHRLHHSQSGGAFLDRDHVDAAVGTEQMGRYRMTGFVDRDRVTLPLDVVDVLGWSQLLQGLRLPDVRPLDGIAAVADRDDQCLVHHVLDLGSRVIGGDRGETIHLRVGEMVLDLVQIADDGLPASFLGRKPHLVDAVDPSGTEHRLVEGVGHVGGHDVEDPVLGRRLGTEPEQLSETVGHPPRLGEAVHLGQQRLEHTGAPAPHSHPAHHDPVHESPSRRVGGDLGLLCPVIEQEILCLRGEVGEPVAGRPAVRSRCRAELAGGRPHRPPGAERVRLVEEDDDPTVAETQLSQLAIEALDLEQTDPEEHVDEGPGLHEHVRAPGLAGHGLCHEGLAGAGRSPEQDPSRDVPTLGLDLVRFLEERDVLLDQVEDVVLTPDVVEPGGDLFGEDDIGATP